MTWFSARNISSSTVPAPADAIWALLTDPHMLSAMTPLVRSIEASGDHWEWTLHGIEALGLKVEATFTERMEFSASPDFSDGARIVFSHEPPDGERERAAVEGIYDLSAPDAETTELKVDLTLRADLPLPRISRSAVERIMLTSMRATGERFAVNLYERLDLDPSTIDITEPPTP